MFDIDYDTLEEDMISGVFRERLREELVGANRLLQQAGEPIPLASYTATKIAEIINKGSDEPIDKTFAYDLYQEILEACERARSEVIGEETKPS
ncbi:MAG TPA: hypothetical protein VHL58_15610 [Thermoanaerobaculia bacterium]|nr:hypothetical protein [Thermoanaerobaculia bacterium]